MTTSHTLLTSKTAATVCGVIAGAILFLLVGWVLQDPFENLQTDWLAFDNAADRLFAGEDIYRGIDVDDEPFPYLYPPFALVLVLPLTLFGFIGSWAISALLTASSFVGGLWLALRAMEVEGERATTMIIALSTGTFMATVLIAQYSGIYVLSAGLALWLWSKDRRILAGLALAILLMKPNIGLAVPFILVWSRSWRVLSGFAIGALASGAVSLIFGVSQWMGFISAVQEQSQLQQGGTAPVEKMVTFVGGVQSLFGLGAASPVVIGVWLCSTFVVGVGTLRLWSPRRLRDDLPIAVGAFAIFVVVANPRLYFYDASLIVLGVFVLWHQRARLGPRVQRLLPFLGLALWFASWGTLISSLNALVAPLGAVLVVLVAMDARSQELELRKDGQVSRAKPVEPVENSGARAA